MQIEFTGRRVLVTGGTAGIGFAAAVGFARAGADVVTGRGEEKVAAAVARSKEAGAEVTGFVGDVGTAEGCERLIAQHPEFDIVVNNIGVYGPQDFYEIPDDEWERFFHTNVMSGVRLARAYSTGMVDRGRGRIVFVSSESALNIPADMIHYGFTKTAQLSISRGLAKRLAGTGVTVNAVLPGPTMSEGVAEMFRPTAERTGRSIEDVGAEFIARNRSSSVLRRMATVDEAANMIIYVCSDQASATTGAALRVDGGVVDTIT